jgi:tetratricopeptide (TPR) repeat protein
MKLNLIALLFLLFTTSTVFSQTTFFDKIKPGPHPVGFQTTYQYDYSRSYQPKYNYDGQPEAENPARLMQIAVWYPASTAPSDKHMKLEEYLQLSYQEDSPAPLSEDIKNQLAKELEAYQFEGKKVGSLKTLAFKEAQPLSGKFPVILYAPSLSASVAENFILCEYLASHGFVVASVPAKGTYSNDMQSGDLEDIETQYQDLAWLLNFIHSFPNADPGKVGVAGFSIGGLSNVVLALKNMHIDAVISLDGSIASVGYLEDMKDQYYFQPERMRAAFCQISKNKNNPDTNPSTFLDQVKFADTHLFRFADLAHQDFNTYSIFFNYLFTNNVEGEKAIDAYPMLCRLNLEFFNTYLKNDEQSLNFLTAPPSQNGWSEEVMSKQYRPGKKVPPTQVQFLKLIREEGADKATHIFEEVRQQTPEFVLFDKLEWRVLLGLGNEFIEKTELEEAIKTLALNLKIYPDWYQTHFALARAWNKTGDKVKAIRHLKACLDFHPRFTEAQDMLESLGEAPPPPSSIQLDAQKYTGRYQFPDSPESAIRIFVEGKKIFCQFMRDGSRNRLHPDSNERFLIEGVNAQFFFEFDDEGQAKGMRMLGLNSGRFGEPRLKVE